MASSDGIGSSSVVDRCDPTSLGDDDSLSHPMPCFPCDEFAIRSDSPCESLERSLLRSSCDPSGSWSQYGHEGSTTPRASCQRTWFPRLPDDERSAARSSISAFVGLWLA